MPTLGCWDDLFPRCEPIAFRLRKELPDRWVRFHSLPESKRYAEDEAEYAVLLNRHNQVLEELIGSERDVVLLTNSFSESASPERRERAIEDLDPEAMLWRSVPMHQLDDNFGDPTYWHVYASVREWSPGLFDPIVRLAADALHPNVMIVNPECRWLLSPYDGGMDVIAESSVIRDRLKSRFAEWLSPFPNGL